MNYKEWADRYLCKWWISPDETLNDIIAAIKYEKPLSYTRFGDGELILLKEYFNCIKNDPVHITMCNADLLVEPVSWINPPYNTLNFYFNSYHNKSLTGIIENRWKITDESKKLNIIKQIGDNLLFALQNSSHIGIFDTSEMLHSTTIDDYYLYKHSYIPHSQLFVDCGVDFKKLTDVSVYRNEILSNPLKFKEILNGKSIHIFTSNEYELKNIVKLNKLLETNITYTNLTPNNNNLNDHPFSNYDFLHNRCSQITEQIVLFGLGAGAKHIPSYLMKEYGKTVIDLGSVLDMWAGKNTRPWMQ